MLSRKISVLAAAVLFALGFVIQPAFADHGGSKPCPMKQDRASQMMMDRTAGSTPVYGAKKDCCKKADAMPCCKGKKGKCAMKHGKKKKEHHHDAPKHDKHSGHHGGSHAKHASADMSYGGPEAKALDAAMAKMHRDMAVPYTGDADADFIRGMIPHHQGAIDMARIVLEHGNDPAAQKLARNIIRAQKGEIAWMKRWLAQRQLPQTGTIDLRQ